MKITKKHLRIIDEIIFHLSDDEKYHGGNGLVTPISLLKNLKHDMVKDYEKQHPKKTALWRLKRAAAEYEANLQYHSSVSQANGIDKKFSKSTKNILNEGI